MALQTDQLDSLPEQIRAAEESACGAAGESAYGADYGAAAASPHLSLDLFNLSAVAMGIVSPAGYWLRANQALADFFGYAHDAFLGIGPAELVHPEDVGILSAAREGLESGALERTQIDMRCLRRDGELLWSRQHLTALRLPGRDAMYTLVQIEDITALKAAESRGRRRAEIYRAIVRNMPGAVAAVFDRDLRYIVVDGPGLADLGFTREMFEGKTVWECWEPERIPIVSRHMRAALAGEPQRYESQIQERHYEVRMVPIVEDDGAIEVGVVVNLDITERKLQEREIQIASEALARSNRELEEFAVVASHDLRAPLVSLHGLASILFDEYSDKLDVEGRYMLERVVANAAQMETLLNDLLNISRVGRDDSDFAPVALADVVAQVQEGQRFSLQRRGGELRVDLEGVVVDANWTRMVQLFTNLIDNAITYTPPERSPQIAISARPEGASWLISVADNGAGIPEDHREDVFRMFHRLPGGKQLNPGGSGMGLALVARIVQLHGGEIWVAGTAGSALGFAGFGADGDDGQSRTGEAGTTFCFTMPRLEAPAPPTGKDQGTP